MTEKTDKPEPQESPAEQPEKAPETTPEVDAPSIELAPGDRFLALVFKANGDVETHHTTGGVKPGDVIFASGYYAEWSKNVLLAMAPGRPVPPQVKRPATVGRRL